MSASTGDLITRVYGGFRGVDFRGDEINLARSPDCMNVWKDYKHTDSIRTRPSMESKFAFDAPVYGVFFFKGEMLVHSGTKLYKVKDGATSELYTGLKAALSDSFIYENVWYFKEGSVYLQYDGTTIKEVEGYVPTTSIARKPEGGGTIHEDVNMLSDYRINTFLADGTSKEFYLDATALDSDFKPVVKVNDAEVSNFTVDYEKGKITFSAAPAVPLTDGQDNVSVKFKKASEQGKKILGCTLLQVFDNRVFFSGNDDYPNTVWHCSLDDPSYCSDLDYYNEGLDSAKITGLVAGNNALWVFREPSQANTTVFYHTPTIDSEYGKIYPSQHSSVTIGCIGKATNFLDDIVFFSERGMEGISGDVTTEQAVAHRSSLVDRKMLAEADYKNMILAEWEGYLFVFIGNRAYLADSRAMYQNGAHMEYEWYAWQFNRNVVSSAVHNGVMYIGSTDGVYTLTGTDDVESWWTTPLDKFNAPNKMKTTNKRGMVVEGTGKEVCVYVKSNKDDDFELVNTVAEVTDAFTCRIKKKKFKDLKLKFYSPKRFSLETATLEVFIGGYLKYL